MTSGTRVDLIKQFQPEFADKIYGNVCGRSVFGSRADVIKQFQPEFTDKIYGNDVFTAETEIRQIDS
jgi:hypothetical protein